MKIVSYRSGCEYCAVGRGMWHLEVLSLFGRLNFMLDSQQESHVECDVEVCSKDTSTDCCFYFDLALSSVDSQFIPMGLVNSSGVAN